MFQLQYVVGIHTGMYMYLHCTLFSVRNMTNPPIVFTHTHTHTHTHTQLFIWNHSSHTPYQRYSEHCAAVKAISWSPHQHGLLASGGGTADRTIRFWNTLSEQQIQSVDTGSQVRGCGYV